MVRKGRVINGIASRNVVPLKFAAGVLPGQPTNVGGRYRL
jgi:hypothetical protein